MLEKRIQQHNLYSLNPHHAPIHFHQQHGGRPSSSE